MSDGWGFGREEGADLSAVKSRLWNLGDRGVEALAGRGGNSGGGVWGIGFGEEAVGGDKTHQSVRGTDPKAPVPTGEQQALPLRTPHPTCPLRLLIAAVQSDLG